MPSLQQSRALQAPRASERRRGPRNTCREKPNPGGAPGGRGVHTSERRHSPTPNAAHKGHHAYSWAIPTPLLGHNVPIPSPLKTTGSRNSTLTTTSTKKSCSREKRRHGPSYPTAKKQQQHWWTATLQRLVPRVIRRLLKSVAHFLLAGDESKSYTNLANEGSALVSLTNGKTIQPNRNEVTMLVDSGATEHLLDDGLIPELKDRMRNPTLMSVPKTAFTTDNRKLLGTMTSIIQGNIKQQTGKTHRVHFPSFHRQARDATFSLAPLQ